MPVSRQDELFPDLTPPPDTRLHLQGTAGKPLTKRQKQFQKQLRKLESLRSDYDRMVARWERFLERYSRDIHPAELEQNRHRLAFIELLADAWQGRNRLGKHQRATLAEILERELTMAATIQPELPGNHERLDAIAAALEVARTEAVRAAHAEFRREMSDLDAEGAAEFEEAMAEFLEEMGLDGAGFSASMGPEDFTAELERQMREQFAGMAEDPGEASRPPPVRKRKLTAAQERAAAKAQEREKARQRTLSTIYKQLAKVLHPDLERDPARRAEKQHVMQELTVAHRNRDLHTLLRLELQWLEGESDHLEALSDEKLAVYLEVLREQVREVEASLHGVVAEPRFQAVAHFASGWHNLPPDTEEILADLQQDTDALAQTVARLQGPKGKTVLRGLIRAAQERQRAAERLGSFAFPLA
ncbi:MAG: J domain-containing protein [Opitutales bacterium]